MKKSKVLIINHPFVECGVHQFGKRVYDDVKNSKKVQFSYEIIHDREEYLRVINTLEPDYIIYNYHWDRMPWLTKEDITENRGIKHYFIWHDGSIFSDYDKYLFFGACDTKIIPESKKILLPRPLRKYRGIYPKNKVPTIGSFGFCSSHKKYSEIVTMVENEFPEAQINFHFTKPYFGDNYGYHVGNMIFACRKNNKNPKVKLNITTDFLNADDLLTFLAGNDINVFNYANDDNPGYSAALDYALSVKRPIAVTNATLLRVIANKDTILGDRNTIKDILSKGTEPLEYYYSKWSVDNFKREMENEFVNKVVVEDLDMRNRILTDRDRKKYAPLIKEMYKVVPAMMRRKIADAVVQQAFGVDMVMNRYQKGDDVLCVGSFEDTSFEYLKNIGYVMTDIDPQTNGLDLNAFKNSTDRKFDIIFSISVMEHVEHDKGFIIDICSLLKPGGLAILTVDFREDFHTSRKGATNKPVGDYRLYTKADYDRIAMILAKKDCFFVDEFVVNAEPDFVYGGLTYGFSTMVFMKRIE